MAKYREMPCRYYIAYGECKKGKETCHRIYCQHCGKYEPSTKVRSINKKKQHNENGQSNSLMLLLLFVGIYEY